MSKIRKFVNGLFGKDERAILKEKINSETSSMEAEDMEIAKYYAILGECEREFQRTIAVERAIVQQRRDKRLGDGTQRGRIHDAAVGLLAIDELKLELNSAHQEERLQKAQAKLGSIIRYVNRFNPNMQFTRKDLLKQIDVLYDDTKESATFTERAELVDDQFVERLIEGADIDECIQVQGDSNTVNPDINKFDFHSGKGDAEKKREDEELLQDVMRKHANEH